MIGYYHMPSNLNLTSATNELHGDEFGIEFDDAFNSFDGLKLDSFCTHSTLSW